MTKIEWTDRTWNVMHGCTKISPGCKHCCAERMAERLRGRGGYRSDEPFAPTVRFDRLNDPHRWTKPRRIFVCSMGDLFHKDIPSAFVSLVYDVMIDTPRHTYQVLTKRPKQMHEFLGTRFGDDDLPSNIWHGVSVECQSTAYRLDYFRYLIKSRVRFVSLEPLISPVDLERNGLIKHLQWVIVGCESGRRRRRTEIDWVRRIRDQCVTARVPLFIKQLDFGNGIVKMPRLDGELWNQFPSERKESPGDST